MIQSTVSSIAPETGLRSAPTFRAWQRSTVEHGLLPVVAVAGGRGKSTVARMVDAIVNAALLRSATWTNLGVELRGRRQRGEIGGWAVALSRLAESSLDIALQEMHWSTINAVGLPHASYPVIALTNLNGVSEHQPPSNGDAESLRGALRAASAAHHLGTVVASADDSGLYDAARTTQAQLVVTALARESPSPPRSPAGRGTGGLDRERLRAWRQFHQFAVVLPRERSRCAHSTAASSSKLPMHSPPLPLQARSASTTRPFARRLARFRTTADILPGSFNTYATGGYRVVIDSLAPSWHVRMLLRAVNPGNHRRQVTVIGDLDGLPSYDVREVGRLLGRHAGAIVLHSNQDPAADRRVPARNRRKRISADRDPSADRAPRAQPGVADCAGDDIALILTNVDPGAAIRAVERIAST